jgi:hypothetical protein
MNVLSRPNTVAAVGMFSRNASLRSLTLRGCFIGWNAAGHSRLVRRNTFVDEALILPRIEWKRFSSDRSLGLTLRCANAVAIPGSSKARAQSGWEPPLRLGAGKLGLGIDPISSA